MELEFSVAIVFAETIHINKTSKLVLAGLNIAPRGISVHQSDFIIESMLLLLLKYLCLLFQKMKSFIRFLRFIESKILGAKWSPKSSDPVLCPVVEEQGYYNHLAMPTSPN
jgi:hypothetical protein